MKAPTIKVGSKTYTAVAPKTKIWRKIIMFNKDFGHIEDMHANIDAYESMIGLLADCYGNADITAEVVEDNIPLGDLVPTFQHVTGWVAHILSQQSKGLPEKN